MEVFSTDLWDREEKLVFGIDIGTTCSSVSYTHLTKGSPPSITRVSRWPGQEGEPHTSKIPSQLFYSRDLQVQLVGAEATGFGAEAQAEDNDWILVKHFKLLLHPKELLSKHNIQCPPILPIGLSIVKVYADYFQYLFRHTRAFFIENDVLGRLLWPRLFPSCTVVVAHPNGWDLPQQYLLRRAIIEAGILPEARLSYSEKDAGLHFVTESEASVHFCVFHGKLAKKFKPDVKFLVCDAGGSTVDTTAYVVKSSNPVKLEEAKPSGCVQAGGIFVNVEAEERLRNLFDKYSVSESDQVDWIRTAMHDFEKGLKLSYPNASGALYSLQISSSHTYQNRELGIRLGRLTLPSAMIEAFFRPCCLAIEESMDEQLTGFESEHILLTGGFGESPYLRQYLQDKFKNSSCKLTILNDGTSKAVSDGAVMWHCTRLVTARRVRFSCGTDASVTCNENNPEHRKRKTRIGYDGQKNVGGLWSQLVEKGRLIKETDEDISHRYTRKWPSRNSARITLKYFTEDIYICTSSEKDPEFLLDNDGQPLPGFRRVCTVHGDLSSIADTLPIRDGPLGPYFSLSFKMGISFGRTQLHAYVEWDDAGSIRRGPLSLIPDAIEGQGQEEGPAVPAGSIMTMLRLLELEGGPLSRRLQSREKGKGFQ